LAEQPVALSEAAADANLRRATFLWFATEAEPYGTTCAQIAQGLDGKVFIGVRGSPDAQENQSMQLHGKTALVTGGTKGIGAATAIDLAYQGADIAIVARHADDDASRTRATIESAGRRCLFIQADMARSEDATRCVDEVIRQRGSVDILVHAAGGAVPGNLLDVTPQAWYDAFDVHVHAVFHLCRAVVPAMKQKKEGAIVLVSSVAGIRGVPFALAYQVVKGALPQFARALARELADDNIRVNCVAPGIIRTDFHKSMSAEQRKHNIDNRIPLHREGTPEHVAALICELVTNDYITGETFTIDGGLTMRIA
jgi:NAD(P)-dependent dehydrogenase (short-subunit alcohol dehydrogenase family)